MSEFKEGTNDGNNIFFSGEGESDLPKAPIERVIVPFTASMEESPKKVTSISMPVEKTLIIGEKPEERVTLGGIIGEGTFGEIYRARGYKQDYAVKLPYPLENVSAAKILSKSAEYQSQFSHPHITPVLVYDTTDTLVPGHEIPFLVMPLAETDAQTRVDTTTLTIQEIITVSAHTANALDEINSRDIFHQDLHLGNVLLRNSKWEITDFGQAAPIREGTVDRTEQVDWAKKIVYPAVAGRLVDVDSSRRISFESLIGSGRMTKFHDALEEVTARALTESPYSSMADLLDDLRMKRVKAEEKDAKQRKYLI